jgi:hypothetical protein
MRRPTSAPGSPPAASCARCSSAGSVTVMRASRRRPSRWALWAMDSSHTPFRAAGRTGASAQARAPACAGSGRRPSAASKGQRARIAPQPRQWRPAVGGERRGGVHKGAYERGAWHYSHPAGSPAGPAVVQDNRRAGATRFGPARPPSHGLRPGHGHKLVPRTRSSRRRAVAERTGGGCCSCERADSAARHCRCSASMQTIVPLCI